MKSNCIFCCEPCEDGDPLLCEDEMCKEEYWKQAHPEDYVNEDVKWDVQSGK